MYKGTGLSPEYSSSQSHTDDTDLHPHHHDSNPVTADLLWSQQHQTATQQLPFCVLRNMKKGDNFTYSYLRYNYKKI